MISPYDYGKDGASYQARAVLAYMNGYDGIEESWDDKRGEYQARPHVGRWENCREQGYVISLRSKDFSRQLNIAFFEHRNSDNICAVEWEQCTTNTPTIDTAEFGDKYKTKWDVSQTFGFGEALKMSEWIQERLTDFWVTTSQSRETDGAI